MIEDKIVQYLIDNPDHILHYLQMAFIGGQLKGLNDARHIYDPLSVIEDKPDFTEWLLIENYKLR